MKLLTLALISLFIVSIASANGTLSRKAIENKVTEWAELQSKMFSKQATVKDAKELFKMYSNDFTLEQGENTVYNKKQLLKYRTKHIKRNNYHGKVEKKVLKTSVGGNVAFVEWIKVDAETKEQVGDETYSTLIEFDGNQIKHIKEYR